jgi:hypothetical protein
MRRHLFLTILVIAVVVLLEVSGWAQGCAMCRTALENSAEGKALAKSFDYGILFLMGIPYAMFGAAGIVVYRAYRRRNPNDGED